MCKLFLLTTILLGLSTCAAWAGVPVRPGIPVYCVTTDGKLYVDKKSILDEWLKENDYELDRAEKASGEAYAILNKAGKLVGYVVIDRNLSMKNAWDTAEIDDVKNSKEEKGYRDLMAKFDFTTEEAYPGFVITNLKVYGPR
jgi:hypothetical protein